MLKRIRLFLTMLLFLVIFSACGRVDEANIVSTAEEAPTAASQAEKTVAEIIVPEGTYKDCPAAYFSKEKSGTLKDCDEYGGGRVCSYYRETKNGQEKIKNLEYLTECHACRFYGPAGVIEIGAVRSELLGLEKKECWQGMYQD